jgi:c-di-GMP-binding flagellar brake protein YcgR
MAAPDETLKFELLQADDYSQYLLRAPLEIRQILHSLIDRRAMITAYLDGSGHSFLTTLLGLLPGETEVVLDASNDEQMNLRAAAASQIICITQLDSVKIQFPVAGVDRCPFQGHLALRAPIPDILLRLQRREYYRLATPAAHALTCIIPVTDPQGGVTAYPARVVDISGGGVAVMVPPKGVPFEPDMEFPDCRIVLPDTGPLLATLRVRNLFRLTNRQGITMLRAGCQFIDLPEAMNTLIHRYILKVERSRSGRWRGG